MNYLGAALIWAATLLCQIFLITHGHHMSGWIGFGGFVLGGSCVGIEIL